jgi:hypothetical protein
MTDPETPELVIRLRGEGFALTPLPNLLGWVDGLHAFRFIGPFVDSVVIRGADCAVGVRVRNSYSASNPLQEPDTVWRTVNTLEKVVDQVLALEIPDADGTVDRIQPSAESGRHHR